MKKSFFRTYLSVDCVVFGFQDNLLHILLVQKNNSHSDCIDMKLPGSLIYEKEDVDEAAKRVLFEQTGVSKMILKQFRCFASPKRTANPDDMKWLSKEYQPNVDRLITVAYLSICKINKKLISTSKYETTEWCPLSEIPKLPFDHNEIIQASIMEIREWIDKDPAIGFELLPSKFTINQLHKLYEAIYNKSIDIRNFHKKISRIPYVIALEEKQRNVNHRAARYYKFDKKEYSKYKNNM